MKNTEKRVKLYEFLSTVQKLCTLCHVVVFIMDSICKNNEISCSSDNQVQHAMKLCDIVSKDAEKIICKG